MHVLFLAPDTHIYNHAFLRGLRAAGARVSGIGLAPAQRLSAAVRPLLDDYRACSRIDDTDALVAAARELARGGEFARIETIDEPLIEAVARMRASLGVAGSSLETALLCRDKAAMKAFLRERGIPCAESTAAASEAEVRAFAERVGYPLIIKPIAGYGSLETHRVGDLAALDAVIARMRPSAGRRVAVEEFVEGHEGFYDTIVGPEGVRHDFVGHYYPGCLEASLDRRISPKIAITNRIEMDGYRELREMGRRVVDLLGIRNAATHMEWFFGPKGLKFSEIGARPAGEKIWDMYRIANDFDVFGEWANAILGRPVQASPSRRLAVGSVQIRPDREGRVLRHEGLDAAWRACGDSIYEHEIPPAGAPTKPLEKGWLVNTWFRLRHGDYDELCRRMNYLAHTVKSLARP